ncbi:C-type lectin-related protein 4 [Elysia marginata]|uniref:C-type lectin-related protein 4 n=1 Tax=Elysia marginata TaxID=1093978 RepID=A0AAV4HX90_9GAST|nr:C-type lectin-related protein 4 [Elysia marginata]
MVKTADLLQCARHLLTNIQTCRSKGFVHDAEAGLCGLIEWSEEAEADIPILGVGHSNLYQLTNNVCSQLTNNVCRQGFKEHQYVDDNQNITTCLSLSTGKKSYHSALDRCVKLEAFLASAKTLGKMMLLKGLAQENNIWVGLDSRQNDGVFVWVGDGTVLTPEKTAEIFTPGYPLNGTSQDCATLKVRTSMRLKNVKCNFHNYFFCEATPAY